MATYNEVMESLRSKGKISSFLDKRPAPFNTDASRNPEEFLDTRPAPFNPDISRDITDYIDPMGGASVVPPPNYQTSYNPAGAYAEAGRTVPNRASERAMAMNQLTQPQGGVPSDLHNWNDPYGRPDDAPFYEQRMPYFGDESVVAPPRMPTERETLDREVLGPANERDRSFSKIHGAYYTGADFGYEGGWPERLGVPQEYIDVYMAVPDEAKQYAHDNPTDAILQQFEEKYGFPLDVSIEISM